MEPSTSFSDAPPSPTTVASWSSAIDIGNVRVRVVRSADDMPPADGPPTQEDQALNDVFCDGDDETEKASEDENEAAPEEELVCVLGSKEHVKALSAKVAALDQQLSRFRKELGSAEAIHRRLTDEDITSAVHEHAKHTLDSTFGELGAQTQFIEKHTDEAVLGRFGTTKKKASEDHVEGEITAGDVLFQRPRVKQYFKNGALHRSPEERKTSWLELFYDLIYVAVIAKLGHHFSPAPSWTTLDEYFVLFGPVLRTWFDWTSFNNIWASDDLFTSALTFWIATLVVGMGVCAGQVFTMGTGRLFIAFYLVNRLTMFLLHAFYFVLFPKFRFNLLASMINVVLPSLVYLGAWITFPTDYSLTMALLWIGILMEMFLYTAMVFMIRYWDVFGPGKLGFSLPEYRTALNIEHVAERHGLFVIIALGEYAVGVIYTQIESTLDWFRFGKAICGLLIAMCLRWVYFEGISKIQRHALRRHALAGLFWVNLHFPLFGFIILSGAVSGALVAANDGLTYNQYLSSKPKLMPRAGDGDSLPYLSSAYAWAFCGTLAPILLLLTLLSVTHVYPADGHTVTPGWVKKGAGIASAVLIALIPLGYKNLNSFTLMAIVASICVVLTVFEMFARVRRGKHVERVGSV
ncbi:bacterial low temperature requirement A protein-domain-containing protein [Hyaloraphidium curvatum]|nr:bacterial low temperature requirement A protein-domain-containing protein [Hyaloraphidium curvatum]